MTPLDFLKLLWQYKPEEQYVLMWTLRTSGRMVSRTSPTPRSSLLA